jgi:hypothetical protein
LDTSGFRERSVLGGVGRVPLQTFWQAGCEGMIGV